MNLQRFLVLAVIYLCTGAGIPYALCQEEAPDSISAGGKNAKTDEIYFDALKAKLRDDDKKAISLLEEFVAKRPEVSAAWFDLSRLNYGQRKLDKAETYIKKAIALSPDNKWYKEQYASLLADKGNFQEAAEIVVELSKADPRDRKYPLIAAEYFDKAKKYQEALSYLDKALQRDELDEDIMMLKVNVYLNMNDVEKAAGVMRQLIAKEPRNGRYYRVLGQLYDNNKLPDKAKEVYDNAQKLIPGDPALQVGIAEHYLGTGDTAGYITFLKKAVVNTELEAEAQLDLLVSYVRTLPSDSAVNVLALPLMRELVAQHPEDAQILAVYGDFLQNSNQHDSAAAAYKRSLAIKSNTFTVWQKLLESYLDKKDADSLVRYSEKAMRLFPNIAVAHYFNSIGHLNRKEYAAAINAIKRAIDMQPETEKQVLAGMYSLLADEYHLNKQYDLSDKAFDKALSFEPNNATVLNNYSYYLSERGKNLDEAEKMSKKSLDLRPNSPTFMDTYGWIQYKKGNYLKAKDFIEKAISLSDGKDDGALYSHLGDICFQLNEKDKALQHWKKAKEKGSDDPLLDKKISEGKLYE